MRLYLTVLQLHPSWIILAISTVRVFFFFVSLCVGLSPWVSAVVLGRGSVRLTAPEMGHRDV